MSFIRSKQRNNKTYYYLVESYRDNGKVRQRNLVYLGNMSGFYDGQQERPLIIGEAIKHFAEKVNRQRMFSQAYRNRIGETHSVPIYKAMREKRKYERYYPRPRKIGTRIEPIGEKHDAKMREGAEDQDRLAAQAQHRLDELQAYIRSDHKTESLCGFGQCAELPTSR